MNIFDKLKNLFHKPRIEIKQINERNSMSQTTVNEDTSKPKITINQKKEPQITIIARESIETEFNLFPEN